MVERFRQFARNGWESARELRAGWHAFAVFEVLYKLLMVAVYAPISAWFFNGILRSTGDAAVSNYDLITFFASPQGLLLAATFATASFALVFFEFGGLVLIAAGVGGGKRMSAVRTLQFLAGRFSGLCKLGFRQFLILGTVVAVALATVAVTKVTLLGGSDIYFYLNVKPPEFWIAVAIAAVTSFSAAIVIFTLLVRWMFAVPLMLLDNETPREALTISRRMVSEIGQRNLVTQIAAWAVGLLLVILIAAVAHELLSWVLMWIAGSRVSWVIAFAGLLAVVDGVLGLLVGYLGAVTFASLAARLFLANRKETRVPAQLVSDHVARDRVERRQIGTFLFVGTIVLLLAAGTVVYSIADQISIDHKVTVTAHRGSSLAAPENSMAAILKAIDDGADYAEIDVQETADGVVVLFHDTDLRRMAGIDKGIWEVTFEEMRQLDTGSWFSEEFSDTRVAKLDEVIAAVKGKMNLNIEMKFNGHEQQLEAEVVRIVRDNNFENECVVTSLDYSGVQEIARIAADLRRGLIVTANIGDVTSLDVDILAVNANAVNRDLITRAHRAGIEVHVWTVNEPSQMLTMMHLGVDNIMTDVPDVLVELQKELEVMDNAEKTLLYVYDFLNGRL
ncbi:MAG: glycerophosphodiester phosphodiesterase family protein [Rhodothermia bacterium]